MKSDRIIKICFPWGHFEFEIDCHSQMFDFSFRFLLKLPKSNGILKISRAMHCNKINRRNYLLVMSEFWFFHNVYSL